MNLKTKKERREQIFAPQRLANGRVPSLGAPRGLAPQMLIPKEFASRWLNLTPSRAFSIAEAMIVFTIVSVAIASVAPMVSKQMKHNDMSNVQMSVVMRQVEELRREVRALRSELENMDDVVPSGTVAFFNLPDCPDGWSDISSSWNGRFPRFAGNYDICDKKGENADGTCVNASDSSVTNNSVGLMAGDGIRNIIASLQRGNGERSQMFGESVYVSGAYSVVRGASYPADDYAENGHYPNLINKLTLDASLVVPTSTENKPKSVTLLGCQKD